MSAAARGRARNLFTDHYKSINWRRVGKRVVSETWTDDVFGRAAQLAYFWLFSLFPLLLIIVVILGYSAQGQEMRSTLLGYFSRTIPGSSFGLLRDTLTQISTHAGPGKLYIGLITTLWAASSGMSSVIAGLNKAYEVKEDRSWWKARLLATGLTIALAILVVLALAILLYGSKLGSVLGSWLGFEGGFGVLWATLQWPLVIAFVLVGFLLVYRFAPNLHNQELWWILPGAAAAVVLWMVVSVGLRIYLRYFQTYATVYGTLGAVLILLLWIYLASAALLIGGEINSEIENAAARSGAPDAKRPGQKEPSRAA